MDSCRHKNEKKNCDECKKHNEWKAKNYEKNREKVLEQRKIRLKNNNEKINENRRSDYKKNREVIIERVKNYQKQNHELVKEKKNKRYEENKNEIRGKIRSTYKTSGKEYSNTYRQTRKHECYEVLGGKCVHCNENDFDLLVLDHIVNDGQADRKINGVKKIKTFNEIIKNGKSEKFQLLCWNCNFKKGINKSNIIKLNNELKQCPTCKNILDTSNFKKHKGGMYYECRNCSRFKYEQTRLEALTKIGLICVSCGNNDIQVLSIDHKKEDGYLTREEDGLGNKLYLNIIKNKIDISRFQTLCLNCNLKKHIGTKLFKKIKLISSYATEEYSDIVIPEFVKTSEINNMINFEFNDVNITKNNVGVKEFLMKYHYSNFGRGSKYIFTASLNNELIAVCKFSPPVRIEVATSIGIKPKEMLELDRFCIHPSYQKKNFASYFLSKVMKLVKNLNLFKFLVSFSDPRFGHSGTIYKATGWKKLGLTSKSYVYLNNKKEEIHKKTVYNAAKSVKMKELDYAILNNLTRIYIPAKIKFVYEL